MKNMKKMTFPALAAAAFFVAAPAMAQTPPPAPLPAPTETPAPAPTPTQDPTRTPTQDPARTSDMTATKAAKTAKGELVKVDAEAKTIAIKGADGVESVFAYNDTTEVTGGREGVAGLATKAGTKVTVHFTSDAATKTATKIEVQDAKK